mmetsp:Transcript_100837/g.314346  ORF Transcript_100837/g.314346 Transcript_100837/m.314346 type:complete len:250 (+) Transcript_100837:390-1139(+)
MESSSSFCRALAFAGARARPTTRSVAEATETTWPLSSSTMATLDTPFSLMARKAFSADCPSATQMGLLVQRSSAVSRSVMASTSLILLWRNCRNVDWVITLYAFPSAPMTTALRAGPDMTSATSSSRTSSPTSAGLAPSRARPMTLSNGTSTNVVPSVAVLTTCATTSRQSSTPKSAPSPASSTGTERRFFSARRSMASKRPLFGWLSVTRGEGSARSLTLYFASQGIAEAAARASAAGRQPALEPRST